MYLTAMTHRDELFNITMRWLNNTFHPEDGEKVTRIFVIESGISSVVTEQILGLLTRIFDAPSQAQRVRTKHELREQIISHVGTHGARFDQLKDSFYQDPEYFSPGFQLTQRWSRTERRPWPPLSASKD